MTELGLAWWMGKTAITARNFFQLLPFGGKIPSGSVSLEHIQQLEGRLINNSQAGAGDIIALLRQKEQQKDLILANLHLLMDQSIGGNLKIPASEDFLPDEVIDMAKRIVHLRNELIDKE